MTERASLRARWSAGESALGGWLALPSAVSAEAMSRVGFDYVCVDAQHGAIDYADAAALVQAIELGGSIPIVRVPWNEPGVIGKMLDAGAQGIIVPMVNSVAEAAAAVDACRYPPNGSRSYGPGLAGPRTPGGPGRYVEWAADNVAVIPMIETAAAVAAIDEIVAVPGVDAIYVGPADLSLSLGLAPTNNDGDERFDAALATIVAACRAAGVTAGIHATAALAQRRLAAGFSMVTITSDVVAMRTAAAADLARARSGDDAAVDGDDATPTY